MGGLPACSDALGPFCHFRQEARRRGTNSIDQAVFLRGGASMKALNFYSSVYHGFLVNRDKNCTIRLGDKTYKYQDGDVVLVTYGDRFKPRKKVFTAVIDQVKVKKIADLTLEELQAENPEMKTPQDAVDFLNQIYKSTITLDSIVTVIHFSEIVD
jgi:hypothetical protein